MHSAEDYNYAAEELGAAYGKNNTLLKISAILALIEMNNDDEIEAAGLSPDLEYAPDETASDAPISKLTRALWSKQAARRLAWALDTATSKGGGDINDMLEVALAALLLGQTANVETAETTQLAERGERTSLDRKLGGMRRWAEKPAWQAAGLKLAIEMRDADPSKETVAIASAIAHVHQSLGPPKEESIEKQIMRWERDGAVKRRH